MIPLYRELNKKNPISRIKISIIQKERFSCLIYFNKLNYHFFIKVVSLQYGKKVIIIKEYHRHYRHKNLTQNGS